MSWSDLSTWWRSELGEDPAYEADVAPLVMELVGSVAGKCVIDIGCGEGRLMSTLVSAGAVAVGVDVSRDLLGSARMFGPVVRVRLPFLECVSDGVFDGAIVSLVLEHLEDEETFLREAGRIVRPGGRLALVINHPMFTAPDSAPIQEDDEVLWRPGRYFDRGYTDEKAWDGTIRFHHRTMASLLNAAWVGGWNLERMVEMGVTESQISRHPALAQQRHIPRLLGVVWRRRRQE